MRYSFIKHHAQNALDYTRLLIETFGGRLAGTEPCRRTAEHLCADFSSAGAPAHLERFETHPGAFNGFYRIDVLIYLIGLALLWLSQPIPAALALLFMFTAAGMQFGYYVEFYDRLYPRKTCYNVVATLEPQGPANRQILLSGHHDSAQELRFLRHNQKLYGLKIVIPDFFRILAGVFAVYWSTLLLLAGRRPLITLPMLVLLSTVGLYFVFTKFSLCGEAVPGAGDNLIASAMLVELARLFADPSNPGRSRLADIRLVFASFDAEELGLRGSRAFARTHQAELKALPAMALNIDSIYNVADLQFMLTDLNDHVRLDRSLAEDLQQVAAGLGYSARLTRMLFGGGATDATELAKVGVRATTMIAMPTGLIRDELVYHTMQDTVEAVKPEAVEACLAVAYHWVCEQSQTQPDENQSTPKITCKNLA